MRWSTAWITVVAGAWLVIAPFATGYYTASASAMAEAVFLGLLIAGLGLWTVFSGKARAYVDYVVAAAGAWSIAAPFALAYSETVVARNSDIVVGLVALAVAVFRIVAESAATHHGQQKMTA